MKFVLDIDFAKKTKKVVLTLKKAFLERQQNQFDDCTLVIRRTDSDSLSGLGGEKEVKKHVGDDGNIARLSVRTGRSDVYLYISSSSTPLFKRSCLKNALKKTSNTAKMPQMRHSLTSII